LGNRPRNLYQKELDNKRERMYSQHIMSYELAITSAGGTVPKRGFLWADAGLLIWNAPTGSTLALPVEKLEGKSLREVVAAIRERQEEHMMEWNRKAA
jgi:hypothetical protein